MTNSNNDIIRESFISAMDNDVYLKMPPKSLAKLKAAVVQDLVDLSPKVKNNPAKVGDATEKTWVEIIRYLVPNGTFEVLNKVVIEFYDGSYSPEIDIVVVKNLPKAADRDYVKYEFVVAAFEVKFNLKKSHLEKIFKTSEILNRYRKSGSAKNELRRDVIYGVLAHQSSLGTARVDDPSYHIDFSRREIKIMLESLGQYDWEHPTDMPDLIIAEKFFSLACQRTVHYCETYPCDFLADIACYYGNYLSSGNLELEQVKTGDLVYIGLYNSPLANFAYYFSKQLMYNLHCEYNQVSLFESYSSPIFSNVAGFDISVLTQAAKEDLNNYERVVEY
ncbi:hypothetical protein L4C33_08595 [Vibrio makurazakiensis]|uniref:DUF6602 domain-containing protein n=1 Tax=Vibrio makurazakiensis TaxID=2910250 RepID=UPI003D13C635